MPRRHASRTVILIAAASLACGGNSPVVWEQTRSVQPAGSSVAILATGAMTTDTLAMLASRIVLPVAACPRSVRLAASAGKLFAVWWSPRTDSTALLLSAVSTDSGRTWGKPASVDSTDHGASGCTRMPPSIAADAASGYVHVTYAMQATEGPGLFFAHSMDGGVTFHAPVPILYGERLGATSVAASGDEVAVAFEDPGSRTPRIGLALSSTMGHIFEHRVLPVSDDNSSATQPLVAVSGHRIAVAWRERLATNGPVVLRIRTGSLP
ncbi:hypothetical protein BH11GEM2_BH11GEM2_02280 [soil metagenome]